MIPQVSRFSIVAWVFFFSASVSFGVSSTADQTLIFQKQVHQHFLKQVKLGRFSGSVAVVSNSGILFRNSYGPVSLNYDISHQPETPFTIASMSKQFLAAGILKASLLGLMDLNAPISKYVPNTSHWKGITIQRLLSHSSGLRQITFFPKFYPIMGSTIPLKELVELFLQEPLNGPAGKNYEYTQYGYHVLALALESATKMPYPQFLKKFVFDPAGMKATFSYRENMIVKNLVQGSESNEKGLQQTFFFRPNVGRPNDYFFFASMSAYGAGGDIVSSLDDLIRWDLSLKQNRVFSPAELAVYHSELFKLNESQGYGFGLMVEKSAGHTSVSHGGALSGVSTMMKRYLDIPLSVIVLSNRVCTYKDPEINKTCSAGFNTNVVTDLYFKTVPNGR